MVTRDQAPPAPSAWDRNESICRNYLNDLKGVRLQQQAQLLPALSFLRVRGLTSFWEVQGDRAFSLALADLVAGMSGENAVLAYVVIGSGSDVQLLIGTHRAQITALEAALSAGFPHVELISTSQQQVQDTIKSLVKSGGMVTGYPTRKQEQERLIPQVERICRGMLGHQWAYVVLAWSLPAWSVTGGHCRLLEHLSAISPHISHTATVNQGLTQQVTNFITKDYSDNLTALEEKVKACLRRGAWSSTCYYGAADASAAAQLANLIRAAHSGEESKPDPIRCLPLDDQSAATLIPQLALPQDPLPRPFDHPVGTWRSSDQRSFSFIRHQYQTVLSSDDLATMIPLLRQEFPGYYVNRFVEFDRDVRNVPAEPTARLGQVAMGKSTTSGAYRIGLSDLTRHGLIAGVTGSGKTNTAKHLLRQLKKPFLVIESAKREYWEVANLEGLSRCRVLDPGDRIRVPYRVNPFEPVSGTRLQTHIDYLLATFKASFDLFPPLPHLLETCVYEVYADRGWDVSTSENRYHRSDYPMVSDLVDKVDVVLDRLAYDDRVRSDLSAALRARLASLLAGNKGYVVNTRRSVPISWLLEDPAVLELEDIADDDVKSFLIGLLLVQLYEYRKSRGSQKELVHLLLIEEAHRLLRHVPESVGEQANPRARAVEFFCNLLAEVRSYGQGILIADQIPTKLASDTMRNTNLKVVHRIVEQEDRETIGRAMNMTPEQVEYLATLPRGMAAVYAEGDHRPKLVVVDEVKPAGARSRKDVLTATSADMNPEWLVPFPDHGPACTYCLHWCQYRDAVSQFLSNPANEKNVAENLAELETHKWSTESMAEVVGEIPMVRKLPQSQLCFLNGLLLQSSLPVSRRRERVVAFLAR